MHTKYIWFLHFWFFGKHCNEQQNKNNLGLGGIWNLLETYKIVALAIGGPVRPNVSNAPKTDHGSWT